MIKKIIHWFSGNKTKNKEFVNRFRIKKLIKTYLTEELNTKYDDYEINSIEIESKNNKINIIIYLPKPGLLIGKKGETVEGLSRYLSLEMGAVVKINIRKKDVWL